MRYMLDTNVCIDYLRGTDSGVKEKLISCKQGELYISSITLSELLYGVNKSSDVQKNRNALNNLLLKIDVLDYGSEAGEYYGLIRNALTRKGLIIGALDMLIGAHAASADMTLVTHNTSEFSRINGLKLEDWHSGNP